MENTEPVSEPTSPRSDHSVTSPETKKSSSLLPSAFETLQHFVSLPRRSRQSIAGLNPLKDDPDQPSNQISIEEIPPEKKFPQRFLAKGTARLHQLIHIYVGVKDVVLVPVDPETKTANGEAILIIDRLNSTLRLEPIPTPFVPPENTAPEEIFGCLGILTLLEGKYLIIITERERIGSIGSSDIWRVDGTTAIPISAGDSTLSEEERKIEKGYIGMLNTFLSTSNFYFSYTYDVTLSAEVQSKLTEDELAQAQWKRVDKRFFWNNYIMEDFITRDLDAWILPVMDGFIKIIVDNINDQAFEYIFISRRSCFRTGARFHTRGADPMGHVANFIETEQLVQSHALRSSFVQTRGSIPLIWHQKGKGLKPKPITDHSLFSKLAFRRHFEDLINLYGRQVIVNLINQQGPESDLGAEFYTHYKLLNNPNVRYVSFDFHEKCKNNKYENLSQLMDQVEDDLNALGYFLQDSEGKPVMTQTGTFRTNCIDCLDRTNVVQTLFARRMLRRQLNNLGLIPSDVKLEDLPSVEAWFKIVWADNADTMSTQYTGTGALKNDYTRTGKRSVKGLATDGLNSMKRYINKTFQDDWRQDSIDLFLGKYKVEKRHFENTTKKFDVFHLENDFEGSKEGEKSKLEIDLEQKMVVQHCEESGQRMEIPFAYFTRTEKSQRDFRLMRFTLCNRPMAEAYLFQSSLERQQVIQLIDENCFKEPPSPESLLDEVSLFIGTWNMEGIKEVPANFSQWIPKGKEFYIIGVQNCNYKVHDPDFPNANYHWNFLLQEYMGDEYICIGATNSGYNKSTDSTSLIAFAHEKSIRKFSVPRTTKARYKVVSKKSGAAKIKGKFFAKLKEGPSSSDDTVIGTAMYFRVHDTQMCFINSSKSLDSMEHVLVLKGENDIMHDFYHMFWFGNIIPGKSDLNKWIPLHQTPEYGSIVWRNLPEAEGLLDISVGADTLKDCPSSPIFVNCIIPASRSPAITYPSNLKLKLTRIHVETTHNTSKVVNQFVVLYAPFLEKGFKATLNRDIELRPFLTHQDYLKSLHITVELWNKDLVGDDFLQGVGVIPLRRAFQSAPTEFGAVLCLDDEPTGTFFGSIHGTYGNAEDDDFVTSSSPPPSRRSRQLSQNVI
eukprot:TRINITY_DN8582_c0_g1_i1.p1 TRINITY_DN8582_c0_g1~~TRINITY_DN8582_c0_g1_i1.p1  ORF type:complete len:1118 (+),score=325.37 TRINITY_DN8582_c0_g1_i1:40-3393(+)